MTNNNSLLFLFHIEKGENSLRKFFTLLLLLTFFWLNIDIHPVQTQKIIYVCLRFTGQIRICIGICIEISYYAKQREIQLSNFTYHFNNILIDFYLDFKGNRCANVTDFFVA